MEITARLENHKGNHSVSLETNGVTHALSIAPKAAGPGSSVNGGELLFLALATCYCNDLYREAAKREIRIERVEVEVHGSFPAEGAPAIKVTYRASVTAHASQEAIRDLLTQTDKLAEVHNTLRAGTPVTLIQMNAVSV